VSNTHKATIARIFEELWNRQDLTVIEEVCAEDFVAHIAHTPEAICGVEAFSHFVALFQALHPDLHFTVEDQIAEGDKVATRWTARAPDLGSGAVLTGISIHRLMDGRVVESWDNWDAVGALQARGQGVFDKIGLSL
jgi:ketosteroid isomerase-like protein